MTTFVRIVVVAVMATLIAACAAFLPHDVDPGPSGGSIVLDGAVPDAIRDRVPLPSCGVERATTQSGPWNLDARRCFLIASRDGRPAEFASTRLTIEGDPFRLVFRVLGPSSFEVYVDGTRDKWGSGRWEAYRCPHLAAVPGADPAPDFGIDEACVEVALP